MIQRAYEPLGPHLQTQKVLLVYGPRRVGKTTLIQNFLRVTKLVYKFDSGDNLRTQEILGSLEFEQILGYAEGYELIAIDEAQGIPNIGKALKILVDQMPQLHILASGSSSFELAGQVGEPLTGRKRTLTLYPVAQYDQQEIDLVEEHDGNLFGYEFKWSASKTNAAPKHWTTAYPNATYQIITPENYLEFVTWRE